MIDAMRCPLCGGDCRHGKTTFTVDLGFGVVVIREVPAIVCEQCGADWIDDDVSETLEILVMDARQKHAMIEVANYKDLKAS